MFLNETKIKVIFPCHPVSGSFWRAFSNRHPISDYCSIYPCLLSSLCPALSLKNKHPPFNCFLLLSIFWAFSSTLPPSNRHFKTLLLKVYLSFPLYESTVLGQGNSSLSGISIFFLLPRLDSFAVYNLLVALLSSNLFLLVSFFLDAPKTILSSDLGESLFVFLDVELFEDCYEGCKGDSRR